MTDQDELNKTIELISKLDEGTPRPNPLRRASARRAYLDLAARLRPARRIAPAAWFAAPRRGWAGTAITGLAATALVVGSLSGVAYASDGARPGDLLYPVDRGAEQLRLGLATQPEPALDLMLDMADERLAESEQLVRLGNDSNTAVALAGYSQAVASITGLVETNGGRQNELSVLAHRSLQTHESRLLRIRAMASHSVRSLVNAALETSRAAQRDTQPAFEGEPGTGPQDQPGQPNGTPNENQEGGPGNSNNPPEDPGPPENPGNSDPPGNPNGPPENPGNPHNSGKPDKPDKPDKPGKPVR